MPGTKTSIVMDVPAKVIYEVAFDFERYPEFLPDVKKATIDKKGRPIIASFEISVIRTIHYTLAFSATPHKKIAWTFVKGDLFKDNKGFWEFEELKKNRTKVTYSIEGNFRRFFPTIITNERVVRNLPQMMDRFQPRARARA